MGEICFILFFLLIMYFFLMWKKDNRKENIVETKGIASFLIYGVLGCLRLLRTRFDIRIRRERLEKLQKLYIGKKEEEIFYDSYGRFGCVLVQIILLGLFLAMCGSLITIKGDLAGEYFLQREGVLGQEKEVELTMQSGKKKKNITVHVPNRQYRTEELEKEYQKAKRYIDRYFLGNNSSAETIRGSLCFVSSIPNSAIQIEWQPEDEELIREDGSVANDNLEESKQTEVTAVLRYGTKKQKWVRQLTVLPKKKTKEELYWQQWKAQLKQRQKESRTEDYLQLPKEVEGKKIRYFQSSMFVAQGIVIVLLLGIFFLVVWHEEELRKKLEERNQQLKCDYPEMVEQFVLLIGAGLTVSGAWERMVKEYQKQKQKEERHYVYEEMLISVHEMENGMSEARAYELFGKRTGLLPYMKFCTLLVQNMKKGSDDLLKALEYEVTDAFRQRKENAKALGEEAGTKLLMPMMLMLVIVFAIILYAAFHNM